MHIKPALKYQLADSKNSILIFYIIILFVIVLSLSLSLKGINVKYNGIEIATVIFLFVFGMNSFKETFLLFMQNSISRKTMFVSLIQSSIVVSACMSIIGIIILLITKQLTSAITDNYFIQGLYEMIYVHRYALKANALLIFIEQILFYTFFYAASLMIGFFITVMYYRLNKIGKIAVSISIPVLLTVGLPIIDSALPNVDLIGTISRIGLAAFGLYNANPYYGMIGCIFTYVIFCGFSWLLMRKAVIK